MSSATKLLNQAVERMTTGYKINHSKDNAANYSISQKMNMQISSFDVAADNVAMGMDLVTTTSDIISNMQDKASRLQALCTQARNGTYGAQSIEAINAEVAAIMKEIDRLCSTAEYNGVSLFEGGTEGNGFIADPVTYSEAQVAAMTTMTELVNGTTSADNTYSISSVAELQALAEYVNDGNDTTGMTFVLGKNLDLSSILNWTAIGNDTNRFKGSFDGNGHVIKNLTIDSTEDSQGLFGFTEPASEIKSVGLENCSVKGGNVVGGLVGANYSSINNCYATGDIAGNNDVGGLVGGNSGTITNCYATGDVSGANGTGGLVGTNINTISSCYATGNVSGSSRMSGGLVGRNPAGFTIKNSYATGDVSGAEQVGGLVGGGTPDNISDSYATGNVTGQVYVGGLLGFVWGGGSASNSYSTGNVTAPAGVISYNNSVDWDGTKFTYDYETSTYSINTDGSNIGDFTLQVGIYSDESCQIGFNTNFFYGLGAVKSDITSDSALNAIMRFNKQLSDKSTELGAIENRLQSAIESIEVNIENLTSSLSTIRDADIAKVSSEYIRQQILQQASATLLSTANQSPSIALQLI